jgi:hypothetical protein
MALPSLKALVPIQIERKTRKLMKNYFYSSHNKFSQRKSQLRRKEMKFMENEENIERKMNPWR